MPTLSRFFSTFLSATLLSSAVVGPLQAEPDKPLLTPEVARNSFSLEWLGGISVSPGGTMLLASTNRGEAFWTLPDWQPHDLNTTEEVLWRLGNEGDYVLAPDDSLMAAAIWREGKPSIGIGDIRSGQSPRRVLSIPKDFYAVRVCAWTPDRKGLYLHLSYRLQRARANPLFDVSPLENNNTQLRISDHYVRRVKVPPRIVSAYEGADADRTRDFIVLLDIESRQLKRVFTGNDIGNLVFSPDLKRVAAIQRRYFRGPDDIFCVVIPPADQLPLVDLMTAKEQERDAGWFDHRHERLHASVAGVGVNTDGRSGVIWAPDGKSFAYVGTHDDANPSLEVFDAETGQVRSLVQATDLEDAPLKLPRNQGGASSGFLLSWGVAPISPVWSTDGAFLYVPSRGHLYEIEAKTGARRELAPGFAGGIVSVLTRSTVPAVAAPAAGALWVHTCFSETLSDGIARLDPATGKVESRYDSGGFISKPVVAAGSDSVIFAQVRPDSIIQIAQVPTVSSESPRVLSDFGPRLGDLKLPPKELLRYKTASGEEGYASLFMPPQAKPGDKVPLVVTNEEPSSSMLYKWRTSGLRVREWNEEWWNGLGCAVLVVERPLHADAPSLSLLERGVQGYQAAVDAALAKGGVDASRLAIYASGFDAYVVAGLLSRDNRFKAAMLFQGFGDLGTAALSFDQPPPGPFPDSSVLENPKAYFDASPLVAFKNMKTPLLLMSYADDVAYEVASRELFSAAREAGAHVIWARYNKYPGDDMMVRPFVWFRGHFRGESMDSALANMPEKTELEPLAPAAASNK